MFKNPFKNLRSGRRKKLILSSLYNDISLVKFFAEIRSLSFYVKLLTERRTNREIDKQTNKRRIKHNLLGGGTFIYDLGYATWWHW